MNLSRFGYLTAGLAILSFGAYVLAAQQSGSYHLLKRVPFQGGAGWLRILRLYSP